MSIQYDPFHRLDELRDRLLSGGRAPLGFPMDAYRRGDKFLVHLDLPGVQPDTVEASVENQVLTVTAERGFEPHRRRGYGRSGVGGCLSACRRHRGLLDGSIPSPLRGGKSLHGSSFGERRRTRRRPALEPSHGKIALCGHS